MAAALVDLLEITIQPIYQLRSYSISIGAGGQGCLGDLQGYGGGNPSNPGPYPVMPTPGSNTTFGPTPVGTIVAYGGGRGGKTLGSNPAPQVYGPPIPNNTAFNAWYRGEPGGSGGGSAHNPPSRPFPTNAPPYGQPGRTPTSTGYGYPSPNQQGYPGGSTYTHPNPDASDAFTGGGGGGAGGSAVIISEKAFGTLLVVVVDRVELIQNSPALLSNKLEFLQTSLM